MTYNEIKACIDKCRKDIMANKKALKTNEDEYENLKNSTHSVESSYQLNLREEKEKALLQHISSCVQQYEQNLQMYQADLTAKQEEYQASLSNLERNGVAGSYSDEQAMTAEVRASLAVLQEQLTKSISLRFQTELEGQLENQALNIQASDVDYIVRFFNKQSRIIGKLSKSSTIDKIIDTVLRTVRVPVPGETDSNKGKVSLGILSVLLIVLFFYAAKLVFPIYVAILFILLLYNISKNYKIFSALIAQKAVKDNLAVIEGSLKEKAVQQFERQKLQLQKKYDSELIELQNRISDESQKRQQAELEAKSSFIFDDKALQARYQNAMKINSSRMQALEAQSTELKDKLALLQKELTAFENDLYNIAGSVQDEYLNVDRIGTDVIFNSKFIVDIKNARPIYFNHPKSSMLVLYDNLEDCNDFIKLICLQLRIKLSPSNLYCTVIDPDGLGVEFLPFTSDAEEADEIIQNLYKIVTDNDSIKNTFVSYNETLSKRIMTIRKSYDNIDEYNKIMVETDSLTETYDFIFAINPNSTLLNDDNCKKVFANGGNLGIYTHLFIKSVDFYNMRDTAKSLVENAGGIFVLKDGGMQRRAKEFALENLIKPET